MSAIEIVDGIVVGRVELLGPGELEAADAVVAGARVGRVRRAFCAALHRMRGRGPY